MDPRLQLRVQRYGWDAAATAYGDGWSAQLRPAHDMAMQLAELKPSEDVLEIACGSGLVTQRISEAVGPSGSVFATDISGEMVSLVDGLGLGNVTTGRMDAEKLDIEDNSYDAALCVLGLMYAPDPRAALREMARVIRPGGRVTATVWGERRNCGWAEIFPIVDSVVQSEVCPMFFATGAPGALVADFEAASILIEEEERQSIHLTWPDQDRFLHAAIDGGAVALAAKRFSKEARQSVEERYLASVEPYHDATGAYAIPGEFVTVRGTVAA